MSIPFADADFEFPQPDGTVLRARGWGNGQRAAFQTLDTHNLPMYTLRNKTTGAVITVTDPGRALITGPLADHIASADGSRVEK